MDRTTRQTFDDLATTNWSAFDGLGGVTFAPLAEPVPEGSIHRAQLKQGTRIPPHTHPAPEYVYVVSGSLSTGGRVCHAGTFWTVPANVRQGPHVAISDTEILTIRLGALGEFEDDPG
jgi:quercetin dioxygenase-like cupin family protein